MLVQTDLTSISLPPGRTVTPVHVLVLITYVPRRRVLLVLPKTHVQPTITNVCGQEQCVHRDVHQVQGYVAAARPILNAKARVTGIQTTKRALTVPRSAVRQPKTLIVAAVFHPDKIFIYAEFQMRFAARA